MTRLEQEWAAWCTMAMHFETCEFPPFICEVLKDQGRVTLDMPEKVRQRCLKRMGENLAGRGRRYGLQYELQCAWWVAGSPARPRYCWRMAELCEAEMEAL